MNRVFKSLILIGVAVFFVAGTAGRLAAQCVVPPDGLVSWWPGEGDGTDLTGGNNGTLSGSASFRPGTVGQAFMFGSEQNEKVDVGTAANLQLQSFTIEGWIARNSVRIASIDGGGGAIFNAGSGSYGFGVLDDGRLGLTRTDVNIVTEPTGRLTDLNFHHVAVTKDGDAVIFYVDGVAVSAGPYDPGFLFNTTMAIGARPDRGDGSFLGIIDELSIYNRALTADEIQGIVAAGSAGKCRQ